jgi:hypothetical protein
LGCIAQTEPTHEDGRSAQSAGEALVFADQPKAKVIDCDDASNSVCLECAPNNRNGIICCSIPPCVIINPGLSSPPRRPVVSTVLPPGAAVIAP